VNDVVDVVGSAHYMSPTSTATMLMLAFILDWMSFGPNSIRDRIAFVWACAAFREGFNGSTIDLTITQFMGGVIDQGKSWAGDAYIAGAETRALIGVAVFVVFLYTIGCLMPSKLHTRIGKFARYSFKCESRINWKLWACAAFLGVFADLTSGLASVLTNGFVMLCTMGTAPMPALIF
jgi:hypothetical protein